MPKGDVAPFSNFCFSARRGRLYRPSWRPLLAERTRGEIRIRTPGEASACGRPFNRSPIAFGARRARSRLHALSALQKRHSGRSRRRAAAGARAADRRAAWGPGRCVGASLRRAFRQAPRHCAGARRRSSRQMLRHQRRQTFQIRAARQAPPAQEARRRRDRRLPMVARSRARPTPPRTGRGARRDRDPRRARPFGGGVASARRYHRPWGRRAIPGHRSPFLSATFEG
jgi:hypothetical protein